MEINADILIALATLSAMEVVLGIDNLVFIAILVSRLPKAKQPLARRIGLGAALGMRLLLLLSISWIMRLTKPLFTVLGETFSGRDLILILGGLFLIAKATYEIYHKVEEDVGTGYAVEKSKGASFGSIVLQIMVLDIVFSLDSVITAVGMVDQLWVMVVAMLIAVAAMLIAADRVSSFIEKHPSVKVLALSFLVLIGSMLFAEGMGTHIPKGYIYFAMCFSLGVELLNIKTGSRKSKAT